MGLECELAFGQRPSTPPNLMVPNHHGATNQTAAIKQIPVPPPPMGWSSWNSFANTVNSENVMQQAQALVASGAKKAGYIFVNIDEGWWQGARDSDGNIVVDPQQWPALSADERPGDMSNIVKYIHSLGLKAGTYTDAGANGCGFYYPDTGPPEVGSGSEGHYEQDMLQFAKWGFDFVKVDWCGGDKEGLDPAVQYMELARAIAMAEAKTGHELYFSLCEWGKNSPWTWALGVGGVMTDIWRSGGDNVAPIVAGTAHANRTASFAKVLANFDKSIHPEAQHTGFYNDPDDMLTGLQGLSDAQGRANFSLWAISAAPLLIGHDVAKQSPATTETITNSEVIAVDQDGLGLQGIKVDESTAGLQVWAKLLMGSGNLAVLLVNRTNASAPITVHWSELGLDPSVPVTVRDLWAHKDLGPFTESYTATVPAGDLVMLTVKGKQGEATRYENPEMVVTPNVVARSSGGCANWPFPTARFVTFKGVTSAVRSAYVEITYKNGDKTTRLAELRVNGRIATRFGLPPTGNEDRLGSITIEAPLEPSGKSNVLVFSCPCATWPGIHGIAVVSGPHEYVARP
jgi:hypothetical protein